MDYQKLADSFFLPTCIVSVEMLEDGQTGDVRIVAANEKYKDVADLVRQKGIENISARAVTKKIEVNAYEHVNVPDLWLNINAMPLECDEGALSYCTFTVTASEGADNILASSQTANDVLKTCIRLHNADNVKEAMENVIAEIRDIGKAAGCTLLLLDEKEKSYSILATNFDDDSNIKRVTTFFNFYDIVVSWEKMMETEGDCVVVKDARDMEHISVINNPWYQTLVEANVTSVVLFPLRQGKELLGYLWATNFDTENVGRIKDTLELTTFFVSSHIARYKIVQRLRHMGYTDTLTDLRNGFAATEYINDRIRRHETFATVSIDVNNFKNVNDTLGFDAGNKVLVELAHRWSNVSCSDFSNAKTYLSRISGDEFNLIISGYKNDEELKRIIECYENALNETLTVEGVDIYITASFGYAEYPTDAETTDALLSHASAAMKSIKNSNSSEHIRRYNSAMAKDDHALEIEKLIREALENDTFFFNLQPQYDMNHRLRGFETLARMNDANGNPVSPADFIPIAEKSGLIDKVDAVVFKKAAKFFGDLLKKTDMDLVLSINASVRHLMKSDFLDEIKNLLKTNDIPADKLEIEITESIMVDTDSALQCLDNLKNLGIQIAIDDFGTGYSSLSYLHKFPANLLKVDKSFIDTMNTSDSSKEYVAAIISIGHIMGFNVISEGVEEEKQLNTLKDIGCDYIQGYIWGRPLPAEEIEKLVLAV